MVKQFRVHGYHFHVWLSAPWLPTGQKRMKAHRLVAFAFIGEPPPGRTHVNHINGNMDDNRPENLEWCSNEENSYHAWDTGLVKRNWGKTHNFRGYTALTAEQIEEIKAEVQAGKSYSQIGRERNFHHSVVSRIMKGKRRAAKAT